MGGDAGSDRSQSTGPHSALDGEKPVAGGSSGLAMAASPVTLPNAADTGSALDASSGPDAAVPARKDVPPATISSAESSPSAHPADAAAASPALSPSPPRHSPPWHTSLATSPSAQETPSPPMTRRSTPGGDDTALDLSLLDRLLREQSRLRESTYSPTPRSPRAGTPPPLPQPAAGELSPNAAPNGHHTPPDESALPPLAPVRPPPPPLFRRLPEAAEQHLRLRQQQLLGIETFSLSPATATPEAATSPAETSSPDYACDAHAPTAADLLRALVEPAISLSTARSILLASLPSPRRKAARALPRLLALSPPASMGLLVAPLLATAAAAAPVAQASIAMGSPATAAVAVAEPIGPSTPASCGNRTSRVFPLESPGRTADGAAGKAIPSTATSPRERWTASSNLSDRILPLLPGSPATVAAPAVPLSPHSAVIAEVAVAAGAAPLVVATSQLPTPTTARQLLEAAIPHTATSLTTSSEAEKHFEVLPTDSIAKPCSSGTPMPATQNMPVDPLRRFGRLRHRRRRGDRPRAACTPHSTSAVLAQPADPLVGLPPVLQATAPPRLVNPPPSVPPPLSSAATALAACCGDASATGSVAVLPRAPVPTPCTTAASSVSVPSGAADALTRVRGWVGDSGCHGERASSESSTCRSALAVSEESDSADGESNCEHSSRCGGSSCATTPVEGTARGRADSGVMSAWPSHVLGAPYAASGVVRNSSLLPALRHSPRDLLATVTSRLRSGIPIVSPPRSRAVPPLSALTSATAAALAGSPPSPLGHSGSGGSAGIPLSLRSPTTLSRRVGGMSPGCLHFAHLHPPERIVRMTMIRQLVEVPQGVMAKRYSLRELRPAGGSARIDARVVRVGGGMALAMPDEAAVATPRR